jgi:pimeloyl-ACP methyl ester carboxylesterase
MPRITLNTADLYYDARGSGEPLLLLHDYFGTHSTWDGQRRLLARYFRVIAPDFRAHGMSTFSGRRLRVDDLAEDMVALIDEAMNEPVHVIGLSLGAVVALNLAREVPSRVRSVVACSVPYFGEPSALRHGRRFVEQGFSSIEPEIARRHADHGPEHARKVLLENFRMDLEERPTAHSDAYDRASEIKCPVLIAGGDRDPVFPVTRAAELYGRLTHSRMAVVPGTGHTPHREHPAIFDAIVLDFLFQNQARKTT